MEFRLTGDLPRKVKVGSDSYVVDLVQADFADDCWLRARACDEPVVFLLAHFSNLHDGQTQPWRSFEVEDGVWQHRLMERLVADGYAEAVRPRDRVLRHPRSETDKPSLARRIAFSSLATRPTYSDA
ncbi:MAG TPA: hypothetical protein VHF69_10445 [Candidatus Synoicihabitans sp.]|nr:hypothetical protein [Candidatus Synoicihabitans sp.]